MPQSQGLVTYEDMVMAFTRKEWRKLELAQRTLCWEMKLERL